MFSSKSKESAQAASAAPAQAASQQKRLRSGAAPSIISGDLVVNGTLHSTGDIQIDGRVEGDVHSAGLVVGDKAVIHGEVFAEDITVRGRIEGSIRARKVLLCSTCHVEGNILHEAFAVETGAFFEGNCRHADNALAEDVTRKPSEVVSRPAAPTNVSPAITAMPPSVAATVAPAARPNGEATSRPLASSFAPLKAPG